MSGIDLGTCLEGGETKTLRYGLWQNDQFGKYHLESYNTSTVYSVITTGDSVYVINLSVDEESEGMTAAFQKLLNQKLQGE